MIKMIKENYNDFDEVNRFKVCLYYDPQFRDVAECEIFDDLSDAENHAHELLQWGNVSIEDYFVGELDIDSDDYWLNFDGEFICLPSIAKWQNEVWKSMGIKTESRKSRKAIKESTNSKIPYDLVSMLVVIRDFRDTDSAYVSDEHKKLVDIADAIYNNGSGIINYMDDDYKALYNKYGKKYFDLVLKDAEALDSQVSPSNINDLLDDYSERANSFLGESTNHEKSRKAIKEDIFDDEDWGYGFDSNGDAIPESTVEELYRIAEYEILPQSELADYDEYVSINEDSWEFYMSSPYVNEEYTIYLTLTNEDIDFNSYVRTDETIHPDLSVGTSFAHYDAKIEFNIYAKDGRVDSVEISDVSIYRPDGAYDSYNTDKFDEMFDSEAIIEYVANLASKTVEDIYNGTTNL